MIRKIQFLLIVFVSIVFLAFPQKASAAEVKGKIIQKGDQRVVQLWGTHYEMGYAHGRLLAADIMNILQGYIIDYLLQGNTSRWAQSSTIATTKMNYGRFEDEIKGVYDGMVDSGVNMNVSKLGRNLTLADLKVWVGVYDVNLVRPQCSSFAVWGNSSATGTLLHGRNFDFPYDSGNAYAIKTMTIFALSPTNGQKYMYVSWPGMLGPASGLNEAGLGLTINVSNGAVDTSYTRSNYRPAGLALREVLEDAKGTDPVSQVQGIFTRNPLTRSGNVLVSQADRAVVVEIDSNGASVHGPSSGQQHVYATNHVLDRPPGSGAAGGSTSRYNLITSTFSSVLGGGDRKMDKTEATTLLKGLTQNTAPTTHSIIIYPASKSADIFFARVSGGVTLAPYTTPVSYAWNDFFAGSGGSTGKPGDADGDNDVDGVDYTRWLNNYNTQKSGPTNGDFNNNGVVDGVDYTVWLNNYGS